MKHKRREFAIGNIIGFVIIASLMFSFSASAKDKNIEVIKGKRLRDVVPSFWENTKTISIYYVSMKWRPDISPFISPIRATIGGAGGLDTTFQEKINNCLQSYHWNIHEYLIDQLKQRLHLNNKDAAISLIDLADKDVGDIAKTVLPSDKHIVLMPSFHMFGIRKGSLDGHVYVAISTNETMQQYIKNCNTLPLFSGTFPGIASAKKENQLSQHLEHIKLYPGLYRGGAAIHTKEFSKDEWLSENGAFLERQLQSLVNDLAKGVGELFF